MSSHLPQSVIRLIEEFSRLPGIGPKTAERLTFHLLRADERKPRDLGDALLGLKKGILLCAECFNFCTESPCELCSNVYREKNVICVVEEPLDIVAIEKTHKYKGLYHVLHGAISPIDGIGPDNLKIAELIHRVKKSRHDIQENIENSWQNSATKSYHPIDENVRDTERNSATENPGAHHKDISAIDELILATSLSLQGEATAQYIYNALRGLTSDRQNPVINGFQGIVEDKHGLPAERPDLLPSALPGLPAHQPDLNTGRQNLSASSGGPVNRPEAAVYPQIHPLRITRIAKGLPVGGNLEYADVDTIGSALIGRKEF